MNSAPNTITADLMSSVCLPANREALRRRASAPLAWAFLVPSSAPGLQSAPKQTGGIIRYKQIATGGKVTQTCFPCTFPAFWDGLIRREIKDILVRQELDLGFFCLFVCLRERNPWKSPDRTNKEFDLRKSKPGWTGTANILRWGCSFFLNHPGNFCRQSEQEAGCPVPDCHSSTSPSAFTCLKSAAPQIITAVHEDRLQREVCRLRSRRGLGGPEHKRGQGERGGQQCLAPAGPQHQHP